MLSWMAETDQFAAPHVISALRTWDGNYDASSHGALAFELVFYHLARALVPAARESAYDAAWGTRALIWDDVLAAPLAERRQALATALRHAARNFGRGKPWGRLHRLRLAHPLGIIPGLGRAFRLPDWPASGTSETLMKTAHGLTNKRHNARYGSVARWYIECTLDNAVRIGRQRAMVKALPCKVITMECGHSPFYSNPEELAEHLEAIAAS